MARTGQLPKMGTLAILSATFYPYESGTLPGLPREER